MNSNIFYLIPCLTCILWFFIFMVRKKNHMQRMAMQMLFLSAVYFFLYMVIFSPGIDYRYVCMADVVVLPWVLALLASLAIFVHSHMREKILSSAKIQWLYMPVFVEGGIVAVLYYLIGIDNVADFYSAREAVGALEYDRSIFEVLPKEFDTELFHTFYLFDYTVINILIIVMSIVVIGVCHLSLRGDGERLSDIFYVLFRGKETNTLRTVSRMVVLLLVTVMPLALLGRIYVIQHHWVGCTISLLVAMEVFMLCHCEVLSGRKSFTLYELFHVDDGSYLTASEDSDSKFDEVVAEQCANDANMISTMTSLRVLEKNNSIIEKLHKSFDEDRVWLNADLKLSTLAEELGVNRNKLSIMFNQVYGNDFKSHVANLRIEEAKRLMMSEPLVTLEYVALHSGFRESTVFLHRFKDVVGMTPTEWKTNNNISRMTD